ncbi:thiolase domain-containing protein [Acidianus sulfidivorans JP7]|uniref:Thiolase domain-containing protein n=1 Tax=Acidianus sulfidivorans JP7 TaxID=619593 RepID=A0A2U9IQ74_9CREN|nr:thiolase domain-containing protein [Acidianus sulfidivorans]AWR98172.1 thiolase domain-containing protein [Acidianus sulfidivorans JP7]
MKVGIIGVGWYGFKPNVKDSSFREMMFEAATRAYEEANINPREDVDTFISCQEDFWEGISISDEFAPDPIGGAMRPTMTVTGDGLQGIVHGIMHITSGLSNITVVEAHAKPSDILTIPEIVEFAHDPIYGRINAKNSNFLAGLDAVKFMQKTKIDREDLANVVVKNKELGLKNPRASYASKISVEDVLNSEYVIYPLTELDISRYVDGAITVVLAKEEIARKYADPIWITGASFSTDSTIELSELGEANYLKISSRKAYKQSKLTPREINSAFVDDTYSFKELEHIEALELSQNVKEDLREGQFHPGGRIPVNPLGGLLSVGRPLEASGLSLLLDAIEYLREGKAENAVVASWRGIPTFTGGVLVVSRK